MRSKRLRISYLTVRILVTPLFQIVTCLTEKKIYNSIKNEKGPSYNIFGSDGCGYITYGLYKSASNKVYVMTYTFPDCSFTSFFEIDNERWFDHPIF